MSNHDTSRGSAQLAAERLLGSTALALLSRVATPILLGVAGWMVSALVEIRQDMVRLQGALTAGVELAAARRDNDIARIGGVEGRISAIEVQVRQDREEIVMLRQRVQGIEEYQRRPYQTPPGAGGR